MYDRDTLIKWSSLQCIPLKHSVRRVITRNFSYIQYKFSRHSVDCSIGVKLPNRQFR